jgi:hypothetical protein
MPRPIVPAPTTRIFSGTKRIIWSGPADGGPEISG